MKKRVANILIVSVMLVSIFSGCDKEGKTSDTSNEVTGENIVNLEEETKNNSTHADIKEDVIVVQNENVYDGINRIAITFYGDSSTQMGLSWYTPNNGDITYGNDIEVILEKSMDKVDIDYEVDTGEAEYDVDSMYHQTVIKGLEAGEKYYFRVGDKAANQWSEYGSFTTNSSANKEFSFIAVTDTQSAHLPDAYFSAETIEKALELENSAAFIMHSGDFVDDGDEETLWLAQMNASKEVLLNNIIVPAVGNHEEDDHSWWQHFKVEHTNDHKTTGAYYSYNYGNAHFVVLDTNKTNTEATSYIDDEQLEWLKEDLQNAKDNGFKWIIVNMHKGLYTVGEHSDNEKYAGEEGARVRVGQVFEEYGVDLVIQGHDHCPSVTYPIKDGKVDNGGVIYINTGSAGAKAYELDMSIMEPEYYELFEYMPEGERKDDTFQNFAIINVTDSKITVKMYEMNLLINENNLYIIKEFEIAN